MGGQIASLRQALLHRVLPISALLRFPLAGSRQLPVSARLRERFYAARALRISINSLADSGIFVPGPKIAQAPFWRRNS